MVQPLRITAHSTPSISKVVVADETPGVGLAEGIAPTKAFQTMATSS